MFHFLQALLVALAVAIDAAGANILGAHLRPLHYFLEYCKVGLPQLTIA